MFLLLFYLFLAIFFSFLCSILEAVLLSITPSYIESVYQSRPSAGQKLRDLKQNIDKPLAAILSLNTIAHTVGAAGVGYQAGQVFGDDSFTMTLISGVLTLLILVFSEIIPKSIGATYWRNLANFTANVLQVLIKLLLPLVWLSQMITKLLSSKDKQNSISRAEFSAMADIGEKEGVFAEGESRVIKNLLRFKSVKAEDIMTPRTVVLAAAEETTIKEIYENREYLRFSRIPIFQGHIDNVRGFIHKHDLLDKMARDEHDLPISAIRRDILTIPEKMPIPRLFEKLIEQRDHIALAVDEYGGFAGIVTMEDVLEALLGIEIVDEFDGAQDMRAYARERWQNRAKGLDLPEAHEEQPEKGHQPPPK